MVTSEKVILIYLSLIFLKSKMGWYLSHNIFEAQKLDIWNPSKELNAIDVQ